MKPLHDMVNRPQNVRTLDEVEFKNTYITHLNSAEQLMNNLMVLNRADPAQDPTDRQKDEAEQLIRDYRGLHLDIRSKLKAITKLNLNKVSTKLLEAKDMQLVIPGTYEPNKRLTQIKSIAPEIDILSSKQKPRKILINGSDGVRYQFLLKGSTALFPPVIYDQLP